MRTAQRVGTGEAFLPDVALLELITAYRREPSGRSRDRLQAAVMRKRGKGEGRIARRLGRAQSAVSCWLRRMAAEGIGGRHDRRSPGRPCRLSEGQRGEVRRDLLGEPTECGFERGTWTAGLLAAHILRKFGVRYGRDGALALAHRLGFSVRRARPVHHKTATAEGERRYVEETAEAVTRHARAGYGVVCVDASALENGSSHSRGLRAAGGAETVKVNFSKKTTKMIGAVGANSCHFHFCERAGSDDVIALLETLRRRHGRVFVILDNAKAHKSKAVREYPEGARGTVAPRYLPPYTPQHNPIEVLWREIKRAVAGRYFEGGFDQMRRSIIRMISGGEVCVPRLFGYMLDAIKKAEGDGASPAPDPR